MKVFVAKSGIYTTLCCWHRQIKPDKKSINWLRFGNWGNWNHVDYIEFFLERWYAWIVRNWVIITEVDQSKVDVGGVDQKARETNLYPFTFQASQHDRNQNWKGDDWSSGWMAEAVRPRLITHQQRCFLNYGKTSRQITHLFIFRHQSAAKNAENLTHFYDEMTS